MKKSQFIMLLSLVGMIGFVGYMSATDLFDEKNEGKTGLKDMCGKLNKHIQSQTYYGTQGNLLRTVSTNTFPYAFASAPLVIVTTTDGVLSTNVVTVSTTGATIAWGATNISYKMIAIGEVNP